MFYLIYLSASCVVSFLLAKSIKKYFFQIFFILLVIFLTPSQIDVSKENYAPSVFTFIFNFLLQQDSSMLVLRPLILTIPLSIMTLSLYSFAKRRFF